MQTSPETLDGKFTEIRVRGKATRVHSARIQERTVVIKGGWLKTAQIFDEELVEGEIVKDPPAFIARLKASGLGADIFTFAQPPPRPTPECDYHLEWNNWAVVPITQFAEWWEKRLPQESRKNVRRAAKKGVTVRTLEFNDELVTAIQKIYNETPVRQGRKFWHFGKDFETVKLENATYLDRSDFIGAFAGEELIGFIKLIYVDHVAMIIQILARNNHQDKRPMNALLAHTVELCERKRASLLVYGEYIYGKKNDSSLTEFKRRNGFEQIAFPRYFVPLTIKGRLALKLGLHLGVANLLPKRISDFLLACRSKVLKTLPPPKKMVAAEDCTE